MKVARLPDGSPEVFHTLQGEGPSLGSPTIFLRLSLCNLHCFWCDTPYTWNWENTPWNHQEPTKYSKSEQILTLSPEELAPHLTKFPCNRLVITGGEPLLQQSHFPALLKLLPEIKHLEIETNGTQIPQPELLQFAQNHLDSPIQFNVSPKLSNSGIPESLRLNPAALQSLVHLPHAIFKFVVTAPSDLAEVLAIQSLAKLPASRIFLMPEGRTPEILHQRSLWLADLCRDRGYRFSPRLHVLLWGNQRAK